MMNPKPLLIALSLSLSLGAFGSARAEDEKAKEVPTFAVLKVDKGDVIEFKVVPSADVTKEKTRLQEESKVQRAEWKFQKNAFLKDKDNEGKEYSVPEPTPVKVSVAKGGFKSEDDAQRYADEHKKAADQEREEADRKKRKPGTGGGGAAGGVVGSSVVLSTGGITIGVQPGGVYVGR